jgi:sporulation protein YlmC with PRC-barrel domain
MKNALVIVAAAAALVTLPALAEDAGTGVFVDAQSANQYLARDQLIGAKVLGKDGKIVGDIEDLIVNDSNQVVGVVMGTGGFFGVAEKRIGVNLSALKFEDKDGKMAVSLPEATKAALDAAPAFKRTQPAKSLFERAQEKVRELTDKTSASTQDAIEKAKPVIEQATEKAKEAVEKAKPAFEEAKVKAQEALEKAKEAAAPAIEAAKEAVGDAIDKAKEAAKDASNEPTTDVTPSAEPAPEAAKPAPEAAAPAATDAAAPAPAETPAAEPAPAVSEAPPADTPPTEPAPQ